MFLFSHATHASCPHRRGNPIPEGNRTLGSAGAGKAKKRNNSLRANSRSERRLRTRRHLYFSGKTEEARLESPLDERGKGGSPTKFPELHARTHACRASQQAGKQANAAKRRKGPSTNRKCEEDPLRHMTLAASSAHRRGRGGKLGRRRPRFCDDAGERRPGAMNRPAKLGHGVRSLGAPSSPLPPPLVPLRRMRKRNGSSSLSSGRTRMRESRPRTPQPPRVSQCRRREGDRCGQRCLKDMSLHPSLFVPCHLCFICACFMCAPFNDEERGCKSCDHNITR